MSPQSIPFEISIVFLSAGVRKQTLCSTLVHLKFCYFQKLVPNISVCIYTFFPVKLSGEAVKQNYSAKLLEQSKSGQRDSFSVVHKVLSRLVFMMFIE